MPGPLSCTTTRNRPSPLVSSGSFFAASRARSCTSIVSSGRMPASSQASRELSTASLMVVRSALDGLSKPRRWRFFAKNSETEISRWPLAMSSALARRAFAGGGGGAGAAAAAGSGALAGFSAGTGLAPLAGDFPDGAAAAALSNSAICVFWILRAGFALTDFFAKRCLLGPPDTLARGLRAPGPCTGRRPAPAAPERVAHGRPHPHEERPVEHPEESDIHQEGGRDHGQGGVRAVAGDAGEQPPPHTHQEEGEGQVRGQGR